MRFRILSLALLCLGVSAGCRYEGIWTGAEFTQQGRIIRLAAAEPLCGCLRLTNISTQQVHLRSVMQGEKLGQLDLPAGTTSIIQFDWGGPLEAQSFEIDASTMNGQPLRAQDVVRIDDTGWPWHACSVPNPVRKQAVSCEDGPLKLQSGRARLW